MKRRTPNSPPEIPAPPRRKRGLSEEDRALWANVPRPVNPPPQAPTALQAAHRRRRKQLPCRAQLRRSQRPHRGSFRITSGAAAGADRIRERSQLSRGRKEIDARIDLHGMTQVRAHRVLRTFLQRAHERWVDLRAGLSLARARSVAPIRARRAAPPPQWLSLPEFRSLVVGFRKPISAMAARARFMSVQAVRS